MTAEAEQHNPDLSNTMNSGGSPNTHTNKPSIPTPDQAPRLSNQSTANTLPTTFQSDPTHSEAFTSDRRDSPTTTTSLGLLNLPSDLLPIVSETGLSTINSKAPTIPSVLTAVDDMLSEIDMDTVSSLDWIMAPESDRSLITGWNALSETDTLPLDFAPTTTTTPLAETLLAPENNITVSIPTVWNSPNQEDSLDQEAGSAAHIGPVEDPSQLHHTSYKHQLSHQQPATSTLPQAANTSSRSWQKVSVARTTAKPLITPLFSGHDQMVGNGGLLNAIAEGETALISSSMPPVPVEHNGGGLVLHSSNMPSSQPRSFIKTKEICGSRLCGTSARLIKESRTTSTSINMVPEQSAVPTNTTTVPNGPEGRPSTTTTSNTATSTVSTDSILDQLQRAQLISRQNMGVATGAVSAGIAFFILTFVLHHFMYQWVSRQHTGMIQISRKPITNTNLPIELLPRRPQNPEVSYFSDSS